MVWNQPGNNGQNRDPWEDNSNNGNNASGNHKNDHNQSPPDLDDIFRKLSKKLSGLGSINTRSKKSVNPQFPINWKIISFFATIFICIWLVSGLYTIKEAERGVVTSFGKFDHIVQPGLNWKPTFIAKVIPVNVKAVRELAASGVMLTSDENVVRVEMNVQYRVTNPAEYLFNVINADDSLRQATDSALRAVIGKYSMDTILTEGRTIIRTDTHKVLEETINPYKMGITLLDVNFQTARPPEEVKAAFDDAIAARENEQQFIREAEAYTNEVQPRANGQAQRILEDARAYKDRTILEAQGEVGRFMKLLPEYKASPQITRERMYLEAMEKVFSNTRKLMIDDKNNHIMILPLDQLIHNNAINQATVTSNNQDTNSIDPKTNIINKTSSHLYSVNNMIDQRQANAQRNANRHGENN
ncbi:Modulator of FtsH protease HflK [Candidatus Profftia lariciata]|uniref:FtsH protease activity modulator HflK n=1 Tax=Candidatus Profftia lariciata TaxID=1987921 RepID=UPI001D00FDB2|nr:FtsH protease activity modulator HflK [Candidatus Profftia lariciata]UDG81724.1 Modulator of FtsH protease HflK [Candidatus Profftia lariciata]